MRSKIFIILAAIGALYSLYLFYLELMGICLGYCSEYPALLGFLWFALTPLTLKFIKIKKLWQVSGILGICSLVFIEIHHRAICPLCSFAHVLGLILIVISFKLIEESCDIPK